MSRSYKKYPIAGNTIARSEKKDKRYANRAYRRVCKLLLKHDPEATLPQVREVRDCWGFDKDGKRWHGWEHPRSWRK